MFNAERCAPCNLKSFGGEINLVTTPSEEKNKYLYLFFPNAGRCRLCLQHWAPLTWTVIYYSDNILCFVCL